jgi:ADP-ribose pyrophosphatase
MRNILHTGKFLRLVKEDHWEYSERINSPGAVIIVGVTNDRKVVLIEQYRIPLHSRVIEFPAGVIGDEPGAGDETHVEAARRELIEETGFEAKSLVPLVTGAASSGQSSEIVTMFLAKGIISVGKGGGVGHEDITVHEVALDGADEWLERKACEGVLVDPKVYAGLYFIRRA